MHLGPRRTRRLSPFIAITVALLPSSLAWAGPKVTVGKFVPASQRTSLDRIDHRIWDGLLRKYVDRRGRVDYQAWKASRSDVAALDGYLARLSSVDLKRQPSRPAALAFWINAYNAMTIKGILREYPTSSIRNHTARIYGYNIWHDLQLVVGDSTISLHKIEHEVLRKANEPRIHFAIVCASVGCPRLRNEAYTAQRLEQQLTENTREFFASPANFRYRDGAFAMSSILKWFAVDFGPDKASQLLYLAPYLPDASAQRAARQGAVRITYLNYDWSLNDQSTRAARR